jgi:hypothetical protein
MNGPASAESGRCPVCQARFRGGAICSRCGADLTPLMLLVARAYSLRQAARQALQAGDEQAALAAAEAAQDLHATSRGSHLQIVCTAAVRAAQPSSAVEQARQTSLDGTNEGCDACPCPRREWLQVPAFPLKSLFLLMSAALLVVVTHWVGRPKANRHRRKSLH